MLLVVNHERGPHPPELDFMMPSIVIQPACGRALSWNPRIKLVHLVGQKSRLGCIFHGLDLGTRAHYGPFKCSQAGVDGFRVRQDVSF